MNSGWVLGAVNPREMLAAWNRIDICRYYRDAFDPAGLLARLAAEPGTERPLPR